MCFRMKSKQRRGRHILLGSVECRILCSHQKTEAEQKPNRYVYYKRTEATNKARPKTSASSLQNRFESPPSWRQNSRHLLHTKHNSEFLGKSNAINCWLIKNIQQVKNSKNRKNGSMNKWNMLPLNTNTTFIKRGKRHSNNSCIVF